MDDELGTDPDHLSRLLLVQIVYDQLSSPEKTLDFAKVADIYQNHALLPLNAPTLPDGEHAESAYKELLKEHQIDTSLGDLEQCQTLAEPLYATFHKNLIEQMEHDKVLFERAYRDLEETEEFPQDERLPANEK